MPEVSLNSEVDILGLLMKISNDVSSIKTDFNNLKDNQIKERSEINKEILSVQEDCQREIKTVENTLMNRMNTLQTVQNTLVGEVDMLKHSEESKDAHKWRTVISFVLTALGGMIIAKLPDILSYLVFLSATKGGS